jgi:uncharacterized circularly permuted ATP-grasp superfamily protein
VLPASALTPSIGEQAFDEFHADSSEPRAHYRPLWDAVRQMGPATLAAKAREAELALGADGVTFTVYGDDAEGTERTWPCDLIPRIVPAGEWARLAAGLTQRVRALELFLRDVHHGQRILKDGVVPADLVYQGPDLRRDSMGVVPPRDRYLVVAGIDVVRDPAGRYLVLEDNVRTPSGVSYMLANRLVAERVLSELFDQYRVRPIDHYPELLGGALRSLSPRGPDEAVVVLLTPGVYNAAYFEHAFLAREMGIELAEGRDLVVVDDVAYLKTTRGLLRVDVVYRRVDDGFLDPLSGRADSLVGVAGLVNAWRAGNVAIANAPGSGIADDKAIYPYVPAMIQYYLGEPPLLDNVPTYQMTIPEERRWVLAHLDQVVVKPAAGSGGYGMLIGPVSTPAQRAQVARAVLERPRDWIAQPVVPLSRHLCWIDGQLEPRHVDLRPFVVCDGDDVHVVPGGLTRVALARGSLVVNSSQGGGSKDSWVLAE